MILQLPSFRFIKFYWQFWNDILMIIFAYILCKPMGPASGKPIIAGPAIPSDVDVNRPWHIGEIYRRVKGVFYIYNYW